MLYFNAGQDNGYTLRFLSMNDIKGDIMDSEVNQFPLEEEESAMYLVLGGGIDIFCDGWMGE